MVTCLEQSDSSKVLGLLGASIPMCIVQGLSKGLDSSVPVARLHQTDPLCMGPHRDRPQAWGAIPDRGRGWAHGAVGCSHGGRHEGDCGGGGGIEL